jgi:hypothetical protein
MSDPSSESVSDQNVTFHYIKNSGFRVVHIDGAIGSLTPRGYIHAALYSERMPIPKSVTQPIMEGGNLGNPIEQDIRAGVVREVEVGLLLDRPAAESLRNWLETQILEFDKAMAAAAARQAQP